MIGAGAARGIPITEDRAMTPIVEFPAIVQEAVERFADLFRNAPERVHLAEYLTGLLVAEKKNVSAINGSFAVTTDQSCLNRWITEVDWDERALNARRLEWLQERPDTRYSARGVIALDNVLVDHDGALIEDVGYFWDHAEQRAKLAHDLLIANYVCPSGKHYPLDVRRFIKEAQCQERGLCFQDHHVLFRALVDWVVEEAIPGEFTFDNWFTCADNLNHLHENGRRYVGDLKANRKIVWKGQTLKVSDLAARIAPADRKEIARGDKRQWYFSGCVSIPEVGHRVRIVILWSGRADDEPAKILVTNGTNWEIRRILRVYRYRWRGTECFHRDGKQHLGLGDCQLRKGRGHTRHLYLVFLAHSVLMRQLRQGRARAWALATLNTIGEACRAVSRETLGRLIDWIERHLREDHWSTQKIKVHLGVT